MALTPKPNSGDHSQGSSVARATLVEYGDYECPSCGEAYWIVKAVQRELGDDLRFIFRNFPLQGVHPHAVYASWMAEAAGAHGRFWEMHDILFEHQDALDEDSLARYGLAVGLSAEEISGAFTGTYRERVERDFASGVRSGVNGTPTLFINGIRHDIGFDAVTLVGALRRATDT